MSSSGSNDFDATAELDRQLAAFDAPLKTTLTLDDAADQDMWLQHFESTLTTETGQFLDGPELEAALSACTAWCPINTADIGIDGDDFNAADELDRQLEAYDWFDAAEELDLQLADVEARFAATEARLTALSLSHYESTFTAQLFRLSDGSNVSEAEPENSDDSDADAPETNATPASDDSAAPATGDQKLRISVKGEVQDGQGTGSPPGSPGIRAIRLTPCTW